MVLGIVNSTEIESRVMVAGSWEVEDGEVVLNGYAVSFWDDKSPGDGWRRQFHNKVYVLNVTGLHI